MRILRLDMRAFGPFTDTSLSFEPGKHGLHLVYGPNEAGKSSTLRALVQLLYGIPHNSDDNFVHAHQNMRLGGLFERPDGQTLECVRRKGRTNTLRDAADDQPIDDKSLSELLENIDEKTFRQRFGVDYKELVAGGQSIIRGSGELGEILFAAGAGISDLGDVQTKLGRQAEEIFKHRGQNQRVNKALSDLSLARGEIKEAQIPSSQWSKHDRALKDAQQRKETYDAKMLELDAERNRLQRIHEALPLIAQRSQLQEELRLVADAAVLPDEFVEQRGVTVLQLAKAQTVEEDARQSLATIETAIDDIEMPASLLKHRREIEQLHADYGSHRKAAEDRPTLVAKRKQLEDESAAILRELGRGADEDEVETLRIGRIDRLGIQELGNQRSALVTAHESANNSLRETTAAIETKQQLLDELPKPRETADLSRAMRRVQKHGDVDERLASEKLSISQLEDQASIQLKRLPLWTGSLADLEQLAIPSRETIDRFDADLNESIKRFDAVSTRIDEVTQEIQNLDRQIEQLRLRQDVPTESDLADARGQRDNRWQDILARWRGKEDATNELVNEFETAVAHADDLSDRLRREADDVAKKANWIAQRQESTVRLNRLENELDAARNLRKQKQQDWLDVWKPIGIEPLSPREMLAWCDQHVKLADASEAIRTGKKTISALDKTLRSLRDDLSSELAILIDVSLPDDCTMIELLDRCESVVAETQSATDRRRELQRDLSRLKQDVSNCEQALSQSESAMDAWRAQWVKSIGPLGLDRDASPAQANSVLEATKELFEKLGEAESLRGRISGIDRDAKTFEQSVRRITSQVDSSLDELSVERIVGELYDRLIAAQTAEARREELQAQQTREKKKLDQATSEIKQQRAVLEAMCREASCTSADELPNAERRSQKRQDLEQQIQTLEQHLAKLTAGKPVLQFVDEATEFQPDEIEPKIRLLDDEIGQLQSERSDVLESIGSLRTELARMDGSGHAAEAQEQVEHLLATIRTDAEQYVRLRLASLVLRGAIERYREKNQGPVLQLASELFSDLTLGSFDGLRADYNDKGEPMLMAVRAGGQTVDVTGLSEGTESQLYLALRLASLETYLDDRPPIPFIVDDILKDYDDDRSVAALKSLARLSEKTQVILFTHHQHLVRLAEQNLDQDVLFTPSFDRATPTTIVS